MPSDTSRAPANRSIPSHLHDRYVRLLRRTAEEAPRAGATRVVMSCDVMTLATVLGLAVGHEDAVEPQPVSAFIEECTAMLEASGFQGWAELVRFSRALRHYPKQEVESLLEDVLRKMGVPDVGE